MYGPMISGDALDVYDDMIVTGSNRNKEVIQIFSLGQRALVQNIEWEAASRRDIESGFVYATKFSKPKPNLIIAGGAGKNDIKIFENNADGSASFRVLSTITDLEAPVMSLDHSKNGDNFAFGLQNGKVYIVNHHLEEGDFEGY